MRVLLIFITLMMCTALTHGQEWQTDFDEAKEIAAKDHKAIVLVFQGSDWCAPCIKLDKEVWRTEGFRAYAQDHFVMLKADFPRRKSNQLSEKQTAANKKLAETYNIHGYFPFVVILNEQGKVLGELGYQKGTPEQYIEAINSFIVKI